MSPPLYYYSVPTFIKGLKVLAHILEKGADHAKENGIPIDDIVGWKLAEDMLPLSFQVQTASNTAKNSLPRVAGTEAVPMEDNEKTVAELQKRIATTVELLEAVEATKFADKEKEHVVMKAGPKELNFNAETYITTFALPNFYFHINIAYAILRAKGVKIGKPDYLSSFLAE